jgi:hypothetical protein
MAEDFNIGLEGGIDFVNLMKQMVDGQRNLSSVLKAIVTSGQGSSVPALRDFARDFNQTLSLFRKELVGYFKAPTQSAQGLQLEKFNLLYQGLTRRFAAMPGQFQGAQSQLQATGSGAETEKLIQMLQSVSRDLATISQQVSSAQGPQVHRGMQLAGSDPDVVRAMESSFTKFIAAFERSLQALPAKMQSVVRSEFYGTAGREGAAAPARAPEIPRAPKRPATPRGYTQAPAYEAPVKVEDVASVSAQTAAEQGAKEVAKAIQETTKENVSDIKLSAAEEKRIRKATNKALKKQAMQRISDIEAQQKLEAAQKLDEQRQQEQLRQEIADARKTGQASRYYATPGYAGPRVSSSTANLSESPVNIMNALTTFGTLMARGNRQTELEGGRSASGQARRIDSKVVVEKLLAILTKSIGPEFSMQESLDPMADRELLGDFRRIEALNPAAVTSKIKKDESALRATGSDFNVRRLEEELRALSTLSFNSLDFLGGSYGRNRKAVGGRGMGTIITSIVPTVKSVSKMVKALQQSPLAQATAGTPEHSTLQDEFSKVNEIVQSIGAVTSRLLNTPMAGNLGAGSSSLFGQLTTAATYATGMQSKAGDENLKALATMLDGVDAQLAELEKTTYSMQKLPSGNTAIRAESPMSKFVKDLDKQSPNLKKRTAEQKEVEAQIRRVAKTFSEKGREFSPTGVPRTSAMSDSQKVFIPAYPTGRSGSVGDTPTGFGQYIDVKSLKEIAATTPGAVLGSTVEVPRGAVPESMLTEVMSILNDPTFKLNPPAGEGKPMKGGREESLKKFYETLTQAKDKLAQDKIGDKARDQARGIEKVDSSFPVGIRVKEDSDKFAKATGAQGGGIAGANIARDAEISEMARVERETTALMESARVMMLSMEESEYRRETRSPAELSKVRSYLEGRLKALVKTTSLGDAKMQEGIQEIWQDARTLYFKGRKDSGYATNRTQSFSLQKQSYDPNLGTDDDGKTQGTSWGRKLGLSAEDTTTMDMGSGRRRGTGARYMDTEEDAVRLLENMVKYANVGSFLPKSESSQATIDTFKRLRPRLDLKAQNVDTTFDPEGVKSELSKLFSVRGTDTTKVSDKPGEATGSVLNIADIADQLRGESSMRDYSFKLTAQGKTDFKSFIQAKLKEAKAQGTQYKDKPYTLKDYIVQVVAEANKKYGGSAPEGVAAIADENHKDVKSLFTGARADLIVKSYARLRNSFVMEGDAAGSLTPEKAQELAGVMDKASAQLMEKMATEPESGDIFRLRSEIDSIVASVEKGTASTEQKTQLDTLRTALARAKEMEPGKRKSRLAAELQKVKASFIAGEFRQSVAPVVSDVSAVSVRPYTAGRTMDPKTGGGIKPQQGDLFALLEKMKQSEMYAGDGGEAEARGLIEMLKDPSLDLTQSDSRDFIRNSLKQLLQHTQEARAVTRPGSQHFSGPIYAKAKEAGKWLKGLDIAIKQLEQNTGRLSSETGVNRKALDRFTVAIRRRQEDLFSSISNEVESLVLESGSGSVTAANPMMERLDRAADRLKTSFANPTLLAKKHLTVSGSRKDIDKSFNADELIRSINSAVTSKEAYSPTTLLSAIEKSPALTGDLKEFTPQVMETLRAYALGDADKIKETTKKLMEVTTAPGGISDKNRTSFVEGLKVLKKNWISQQAGQATDLVESINQAVQSGLNPAQALSFASASPVLRSSTGGDRVGHNEILNLMGAMLRGNQEQITEAEGAVKKLMGGMDEFNTKRLDMLKGKIGALRQNRKTLSNPAAVLARLGNQFLTQGSTADVATRFSLGGAGGDSGGAMNLATAFLGKTFEAPGSSSTDPKGVQLMLEQSLRPHVAELVRGAVGTGEVAQSQEDVQTRKTVSSLVSFIMDASAQQQTAQNSPENVAAGRTPEAAKPYVGVKVALMKLFQLLTEPGIAGRGPAHEGRARISHAVSRAQEVVTKLAEQMGSLNRERDTLTKTGAQGDDATKLEAVTQKLDETRKELAKAKKDLKSVEAEETYSTQLRKAVGTVGKFVTPEIALDLPGSYVKPTDIATIAAQVAPGLVTKRMSVEKTSKRTGVTTVDPGKLTRDYSNAGLLQLDSSTSALGSAALMGKTQEYKDMFDKVEAELETQKQYYASRYISPSKLGSFVPGYGHGLSTARKLTLESAGFTDDYSGTAGDAAARRAQAESKFPDLVKFSNVLEKAGNDPLIPSTAESGGKAADLGKNIHKVLEIVDAVDQRLGKAVMSAVKFGKLEGGKRPYAEIDLLRKQEGRLQVVDYKSMASPYYDTEQPLGSKGMPAAMQMASYLANLRKLKRRGTAENPDEAKALDFMKDMTLNDLDNNVDLFMRKIKDEALKAKVGKRLGKKSANDEELAEFLTPVDMKDFDSEDAEVRARARARLKEQKKVLLDPSVSEEFKLGTGKDVEKGGKLATVMTEARARYAIAEKQLHEAFTLAPIQYKMTDANRYAMEDRPLYDKAGAPILDDQGKQKTESVEVKDAKGNPVLRSVEASIPAMSTLAEAMNAFARSAFEHKIYEKGDEGGVGQIDSVQATRFKRDMDDVIKQWFEKSGIGGVAGLGNKGQLSLMRVKQGMAAQAGMVAQIRGEDVMAPDGGGATIEQSRFRDYNSQTKRLDLMSQIHTQKSVELGTATSTQAAAQSRFDVLKDIEVPKRTTEEVKEIRDLTNALAVLDKQIHEHTQALSFLEKQYGETFKTRSVVEPLIEEGKRMKRAEQLLASPKKAYGSSVGLNALGITEEKVADKAEALASINREKEKSVKLDKDDKSAVVATTTAVAGLSGGVIDKNRLLAEELGILKKEPAAIAEATKQTAVLASTRADIAASPAANMDPVPQGTGNVGVATGGDALIPVNGNAKEVGGDEFNQKANRLLKIRQEMIAALTSKKLDQGGRNTQFENLKDEFAAADKEYPAMVAKINASPALMKDAAFKAKFNRINLEYEALKSMANTGVADNRKQISEFNKVISQSSKALMEGNIPLEKRIEELKSLEAMLLRVKDLIAEQEVINKTSPALSADSVLMDKERMAMVQPTRRAQGAVERAKASVYAEANRQGIMEIDGQSTKPADMPVSPVKDLVKQYQAVSTELGIQVRASKDTSRSTQERLAAKDKMVATLAQLVTLEDKIAKNDAEGVASARIMNTLKTQQERVAKSIRQVEGSTSADVLRSTAIKENLSMLGRYYTSEGQILSVMKNENVSLADKIQHLTEAVRLEGEIQAKVKETTSLRKGATTAEKMAINAATFRAKGRSADMGLARVNLLNQVDMSQMDPVSRGMMHYKSQVSGFQAEAEQAAMMMKEFDAQQKTAGSKSFFGTGERNIMLFSKSIKDQMGRSIQTLDAWINKAGQVEVAVRKMGSVVSGPMLSRIGTAFERVAIFGGSAMAFFAIQAAATAAFRSMVQFNSEMTKLKQVMEGTATNFRAFQDSLYGIAKAYGATMTDVMAAAQEYARQGLSQLEIIEAVRVATLSQNVTSMTMAESVDYLTAATRQYNISVMDSINVLDAWNYVADMTASEAKDIGDAFKRSAGVAQLVGIEMEELTGIVAHLQEVTRRGGDVIGTAMRRVFIGVREAKSMDVLGEIGVATMKTADQYRSAANVFDDVAAKWKSLTDAQKQNIAVTLGQARFASFVIEMFDGWDKVMRNTTMAQNAHNYSMRENQIAMQSFSRHATMLRQSWDELLVSFGNSGLLRGLTVLSDGVRGVVATFNKITPDPVKTLMTVAGGGLFAIASAGRFLSWTLGINVMQIKDIVNQRRLQAAVEKENLTLTKQATQATGELALAQQRLTENIYLTSAARKKDLDLLRRAGMVAPILPSSRGGRGGKSPVGDPGSSTGSMSASGALMGVGIAAEMAAGMAGRDSKAGSTLSSVGDAAVAVGGVGFAVQGIKSLGTWVKGLVPSLEALGAGAARAGNILKTLSLPGLIATAVATVAGGAMRVYDAKNPTGKMMEQSRRARRNELEETISSAATAGFEYQEIADARMQAPRDSRGLESEVQAVDKLSLRFPELVGNVDRFGNMMLVSSRHANTLTDSLKTIAEDSKILLVRDQLEVLRQKVVDLSDAGGQMGNMFTRTFARVTKAVTFGAVDFSVVSQLEDANKRLMQARTDFDLAGADPDARAAARSEWEKALVDRGKQQQLMVEPIQAFKKQLDDAERAGIGERVRYISEAMSSMQGGDLTSLPNMEGFLTNFSDMLLSQFGSLDPLRGAQAIYIESFGESLGTILGQGLDAIDVTKVESSAQALGDSLSKAVAANVFAPAPYRDAMLGSLDRLKEGIKDGADVSPLLEDVFKSLLSQPAGVDTTELSKAQTDILSKVDDFVAVMGETGKDGWDENRRILIKAGKDYIQVLQKDLPAEMQRSDFNIQTLPADRRKKLLEGLFGKKLSAKEAIEFLGTRQATEEIKFQTIGKEPDAKFFDSSSNLLENAKKYEGHLNNVLGVIRLVADAENARAQALRSALEVGPKSWSSTLAGLDATGRMMKTHLSLYSGLLSARGRYQSALVGVLRTDARAQLSGQVSTDTFRMTETFRQDPNEFMRRNYATNRMGSFAKGSGLNVDSLVGERGLKTLREAEMQFRKVVGALSEVKLDNQITDSFDKLGKSVRFVAEQVYTLSRRTKDFTKENIAAILEGTQVGDVTDLRKSAFGASKETAASIGKYVPDADRKIEELRRLRRDPGQSLEADRANKEQLELLRQAQDIMQQAGLTDGRTVLGDTADYEKLAVSFDAIATRYDQISGTRINKATFAVAAFSPAGRDAVQGALGAQRNEVALKKISGDAPVTAGRFVRGITERIANFGSFDKLQMASQDVQQSFMKWDSLTFGNLLKGLKDIDTATAKLQRRVNEGAVDAMRTGDPVLMAASQMEGAATEALRTASLQGTGAKVAQQFFSRLNTDLGEVGDPKRREATGRLATKAFRSTGMDSGEFEQYIKAQKFTEDQEKTVRTYRGMITKSLTANKVKPNEVPQLMQTVLAGLGAEEDIAELVKSLDDKILASDDNRQKAFELLLKSAELGREQQEKAMDNIKSYVTGLEQAAGQMFTQYARPVSDFSADIKSRVQFASASLAQLRSTGVPAVVEFADTMEERLRPAILSAISAFNFTSVLSSLATLRKALASDLFSGTVSKGAEATTQQLDTWGTQLAELAVNTGGELTTFGKALDLAFGDLTDAERVNKQKQTLADTTEAVNAFFKSIRGGSTMELSTDQVRALSTEFLGLASSVARVRLSYAKMQDTLTDIRQTLTGLNAAKVDLPIKLKLSNMDSFKSALESSIRDISKTVERAREQYQSLQDQDLTGTFADARFQAEVRVDTANRRVVDAQKDVDTADAGGDKEAAQSRLAPALVEQRRAQEALNTLTTKGLSAFSAEIRRNSEVMRDEIDQSVASITKMSTALQIFPAIAQAMDGVTDRAQAMGKAFVDFNVIARDTTVSTMQNMASTLASIGRDVSLSDAFTLNEEQLTKESGKSIAEIKMATAEALLKDSPILNAALSQYAQQMDLTDAMGQDYTVNAGVEPADILVANYDKVKKSFLRNVAVAEMTTAAFEKVSKSILGITTASQLYAGDDRLALKFAESVSLTSDIDAELQKLVSAYKLYADATSEADLEAKRYLETQIGVLNMYRIQAGEMESVLQGYSTLYKGLNLLEAQVQVYRKSLDSAGKTADYFKSTIDRIIEVSTEGGARPFADVDVGIQRAVDGLEDYYAKLLYIQRQQDVMYSQVDAFGDAWSSMFEMDKENPFANPFEQLLMNASQSFAQIATKARRDALQPALDDIKGLMSTSISTDKTGGMKDVLLKTMSQATQMYGDSVSKALEEGGYSVYRWILKGFEGVSGAEPGTGRIPSAVPAQTYASGVRVDGRRGGVLGHEVAKRGSVAAVLHPGELVIPAHLAGGVPGSIVNRLPLYDGVTKHPVQAAGGWKSYEAADKYNKAGYKDWAKTLDIENVEHRRNLFWKLPFDEQEKVLRNMPPDQKLDLINWRSQQVKSLLSASDRSEAKAMFSAPDVGQTAADRRAEGRTKYTVAGRRAMALLPFGAMAGFAAYNYAQSGDEGQAGADVLTAGATAFMPTFGVHPDGRPIKATRLLNPGMLTPMQLQILQAERASIALELVENGKKRQAALFAYRQDRGSGAKYAKIYGEERLKAKELLSAKYRADFFEKQFAGKQLIDMDEWAAWIDQRKRSQMLKGKSSADIAAVLNDTTGLAAASKKAQLARKGLGVLAAAEGIYQFATADSSAERMQASVAPAMLAMQYGAQATKGKITSAIPLVGSVLYGASQAATMDPDSSPLGRFGTAAYYTTTGLVSDLAETAIAGGTGGLGIPAALMLNAATMAVAQKGYQEFLVYPDYRAAYDTVENLRLAQAALGGSYGGTELVKAAAARKALEEARKHYAKYQELAGTKAGGSGVKDPLERILPDFDAVYREMLLKATGGFNPKIPGVGMSSGAIIGGGYTNATMQPGAGEILAHRNEYILTQSDAAQMLSPTDRMELEMRGLRAGAGARGAATGTGPVGVTPVISFGGLSAADVSLKEFTASLDTTIKQLEKQSASYTRLTGKISQLEEELEFAKTLGYKKSVTAGKEEIGDRKDIRRDIRRDMRSKDSEREQYAIAYRKAAPKPFSEERALLYGKVAANAGRTSEQVEKDYAPRFEQVGADAESKRKLAQLERSARHTSIIGGRDLKTLPKADREKARSEMELATLDSQRQVAKIDASETLQRQQLEQQMAVEMEMSQPLNASKGTRSSAKMRGAGMALFSGITGDAGMYENSKKAMGDVEGATDKQRNKAVATGAALNMAGSAAVSLANKGMEMFTMSLQEATEGTAAYAFTVNTLAKGQKSVAGAAAKTGATAGGAIGSIWGPIGKLIGTGIGAWGGAIVGKSVDFSKRMKQQEALALENAGKVMSALSPVADAFSSVMIKATQNIHYTFVEALAKASESILAFGAGATKNQYEVFDPYGLLEAGTGKALDTQAGPGNTFSLMSTLTNSFKNINSKMASVDDIAELNDRRQMVENAGYTRGKGALKTWGTLSFPVNLGPISALLVSSAKQYKKEVTLDSGSKVQYEYKGKDAQGTAVRDFFGLDPEDMIVGFDKVTGELYYMADYLLDTSKVLLEFGDSVKSLPQFDMTTSIVGKMNAAFEQSGGTVQEFGSALFAMSMSMNKTIDTFTATANGGKQLNMSAIMGPAMGELATLAADINTEGMAAGARDMAVGGAEAELQAARTRLKAAKDDGRYTTKKEAAEKSAAEAAVAQAEQAYAQALEKQISGSNNIVDIYKKMGDVVSQVNETLRKFAQSINDAQQMQQKGVEAWSATTSMLGSLNYGQVLSGMGTGLSGTLAGGTAAGANSLTYDMANAGTLYNPEYLKEQVTAATQTEIDKYSVGGSLVYNDGVISGVKDASGNDAGLSQTQLDALTTGVTNAGKQAVLNISNGTLGLLTDSSGSAVTAFDMLGERVALSAEQVVRLKEEFPKLAEIMESKGTTQMVLEIRKGLVAQAQAVVEVRREQNQLLAGILEDGMDSMYLTIKDSMAKIEDLMKAWTAENTLRKAGLSEAVDKYSQTAEFFDPAAFAAAVSSAAPGASLSDVYQTTGKTAEQMFTTDARGQIGTTANFSNYYEGASDVQLRKIQNLNAQRSGTLSGLNITGSRLAGAPAAATLFNQIIAANGKYTNTQFAQLEAAITSNPNLNEAERLSAVSEMKAGLDDLLNSNTELISAQIELVDLAKEANTLARQWLEEYEKDAGRPEAERAFMEANLRALLNNQQSINSTTGGTFLTETGEMNRISLGENVGLKNLGDFEIAKTLDEFDKLYGAKIAQGPKDVSTYSNVRPITNNIDINIDADFIDPSQLDANRQRDLALSIQEALINEGFRFSRGE